MTNEQKQTLATYLNLEASTAIIGAHSYRDADDFIEIAYSFTGYSAGPLQISNVRTIEEDFEDCDVDNFLVRTGQLQGYGLSFATNVPADVEWLAKAEEILRALNDYPVLDECLMSELEHENMQESWEDYGRDDLRSELSRISDEGEKLNESMTDNDIDEAWHAWAMDHPYGATEDEGYYGVCFLDLAECAKSILDSK